MEIMYFKADWCQPCKTVGPILKEVSNEKNLNLKEINIEEDDDGLINEYKVKNLPTLIFKDGDEEKDRHVGSISKNELIKKVEKN